MVVTLAGAGLPAASTRRRFALVGAATGNPVQIIKVEFIGIPSTDFERSMAFYVAYES